MTALAAHYIGGLSIRKSLLIGSIMIVTGHERFGAALMWIRLGFLVPATVLAGILGGVEEVAMAATGTAAVMVPVAAYSLASVLPVTWAQLARALWRPALAGMTMLTVVRWFHADGISTPSVTLTLDVVTGAIAYATGLMLLWWLSGRPAGPEGAALTSITSLVTRRSAS